MKDEKFCFKKGTGLIALVGIVLVLAVFAMNTATSQQQTTGAKAFGACPNSSLGDPTGLCPANWIARDAAGVAYKDNSGNTCCYLNVNYTGVCPSGSSPDTMGVCAASRKTGVYITRKSDNKQVQCCNFIGTVQNTPAPVAQTTQPPQQPLSQPLNYCSDLGLYPVLNTAYETSYKNMYCSGAEAQKPAWNGLYGSYAKCYTRTGACGRSPNCMQDSCMAAINGAAGCIYKPLNDMSACITAKTAPADVITFTCPPKDPNTGLTSEVYLARGNGKYYLQAGKVFYPTNDQGKYVGAQPYCVNKELTDSEATAAKTAGKIKTVSPKDCSAVPAEYGWGPSYKIPVIDARDPNNITWMWGTQSVCYRLNASNGTACTLNTPAAIELCQCKDFKYNKSATQKARAEEQTQCKKAHQIDPTFQY